MTLNDIRSPGLVPNSHRLKQEVIRAISFADNLKSSEKATELTLFFREAIAYIDREIGCGELPESEKPTVDPDAISPFDDEEIPTADKGFVVPFGLVEPTPAPAPKTQVKSNAKTSGAAKGKAAR